VITFNGCHGDTTFQGQFWLLKFSIVVFCEDFAWKKESGRMCSKIILFTVVCDFLFLLTGSFSIIPVKFLWSLNISVDLKIIEIFYHKFEM